MTKFIAKWREFLYKYSKVDDKESTFKLINDYVIMLSQSLDNDNYSIEMEKEIILENLDENIVNEATFYNQQNIPSQNSKALYLYGSTTDYQELGFVDVSYD